MSISTRITRLSAFGVLAAAGVAATVALGPGASAQVPAAGLRTLLFSEIENKNPCCIADIAPKSDSKREPFMSPGDELVFTQVLRGAGNKRVGKLYGTCAAIVGAPLTKSKYICNIIYSVAEGTITITGLSAFGQSTSVGAVTGGTGAYANARGTYSSKNSETKNDVTITLVD